MISTEKEVNQEMNSQIKINTAHIQEIGGGTLISKEHISVKNLISTQTSQFLKIKW